MCFFFEMCLRSFGAWRGSDDLSTCTWKRILSSFTVSLLLELNRAMNKKRCYRIMLQPRVAKSTII